MGRNRLMPKAKKKEHDFTLVLAGTGGLPDGAEDALFEAGCDDATIIVRSGRVFLSFIREAASLRDAILSAIRDVRKADIGAEVLRVDSPDLVTQADIARRIGQSRQSVHQLATGTRGPGGLPPPAGDDGPVWQWHEVAAWQARHGMVADEVSRDAAEVAAINAALAWYAFSISDTTAPDMLSSLLRPVAAAG
jgi:hypothetical protein